MRRIWRPGSGGWGPGASPAGLVPGGAVVGAALVVVLSSAPALADDVSLSVTSTVAVGDRPAITLKVNKDLAKAWAELKGRGPGAPGGKVRPFGGPVSAPGELKLELPAAKKPGRIEWSGTLSVEFKDGSSGSMPLSFATEVAEPPRVTLVEGSLDLKAHELAVTMNRPAKRVDLEVMGDDGSLLANVGHDFSGEKPGTPLKLTWSPKRPTPALRFRLVGHDTAGFFSPTLELVPWSLAIDHEEIVFDTDKATIKPDEEKKLERVLPEVKKAIKRYGAVVKIRLYILGHTDTVGSASSNMKLSRRRALAIGRWFRGHGIRVPIRARGFGESSPDVPTPDETDELRNRRADYILAVDPPVPGAGWTKVP